ncbi:MAG: hypothetical protein HUN04_26090 [Desulfobacter sp.]|nr:MAG: hypothetical protein HUN04_26090 [Desulfobacter sp.]
MKTILVLAVITACILTSSIAFANIISFSQTKFDPAFMLGIGFFLLGLAGLGRKFT